MNFLALIGRVVLGFLGHIGRLTIFAGTAISHCVRPPLYPRLIGQQMIDIGYYSLPVVGLTAIFSGMVLALQSYTGFGKCCGAVHHARTWTRVGGVDGGRAHRRVDGG
jgi:phospholipid/cholesterol/gamma-HCH transport system permease protein